MMSVIGKVRVVSESKDSYRVEEDKGAGWERMSDHPKLRAAVRAAGGAAAWPRRCRWSV